MWSRLRDRQLGGFKFKRQAPVGEFVVDFVCLDRQLIVEVDGGQHAEQTADDLVRTQRLEALGYRVVRYWNNEVMGNIYGVLADLLKYLGESTSPRPSPHVWGEGENGAAR